MELDIEKLYHKYYSHLKNYAFTFLKDKVQAHDAAIDAIISVRKYDELPNVPGFLFTCVKNKCIDIFRRKEEFQEINDRLDIAYYDHYRMEALKIPSKLINQLHPMRKKVISLDLLDYTSEEIAKVLNKKLDTIYRTRVRALRDLRIIFKTVNI